MSKIKENGLLGKLIVTSIICILPMIIGVATWNILPDRMVSHFDIAGNPNQYMAKWMNVFTLPLILLATHLLCSLSSIYSNSNKGQISKKFINVVIWFTPLTSVFVTTMIFGYTFGYSMNVSFWGQIFLAVIFLVIGNYLPKLRQNHVAGTRIKWTYESSKNWDHTQRFSGYCLCIAGILCLISALSDFAGRAKKEYFGLALVIMIVIFTASTILYSYIYYIRHKDDEDYYN